MANAVLANVNRCVGCWTCSMACKVAFNLGEDEYRMHVRTIGGGGVDVPGGKWPNLYMKWMPVFTKDCIDCRGAKSTDGVPYCVYNCTTEALTWGDIDDPESPVNKEMERLRESGYHVYEIPKWEGTRDRVFYAEKDV